MVRIDIALFCLCIPLVFGAPADESVKQQLSSGLFRNDDGYWNMLNSGIRGGGGHPLLRLGPHGFQKKFDSLSGSTFGTQKRNFDEIDRNGFGTFVKKNFDEIDRVGLGFNKRNFDEIDRTGFGSFV